MPRFPHVLLAALLVPVLAGCLGSAPGPQPLAVPRLPTAGVAHLAGAVPVDAARAALLPPVLGGQYLIGAPSGEPTLGVTKEGQLFMDTIRFDALTGLPVSGLRTSADQGQTWKDTAPQLVPGAVGSPPFTFDPYTYVDPATGRVFLDDLGPLDCSWLSWSDDRGATWTTDPAACGTPLLNDHQSLVAAKPRHAATRGYADVLYYCVNRIVSTDCATSLDGGTTFAPLAPVFPGFADDGTLCGGLSGHVKAAADGRVFLPKAQCGIPEVAISEDDGASWTLYVISRDQPVQDGDHEVSVAADDAGNVYALWINRTGLPVLSVSRDGGYTWGEPVMVAPPGVTATDLPAIAAGAPGRVAVAYIGTTFHDGYANKTSSPGGGPFGNGERQDAHRWKNATWNAYLGVLTDALAPVPVITTATANDPSDPVARGPCGRSRCYNDNRTGGMFDFIDLVVDPQGRPWASFVDMCTETCANDPSANKTSSEGFVGTLRAGPSLRGAGELPLLAPQAMHPAPGSSGSGCAPCALRAPPAPRVR